MPDATTVTDIAARLALLLPYIDPSAPTAAADPPNSISPGAGYTWIILPGTEHPDFDWGGRVSAFNGPQGGVYVSVRTYKILLIVGALGSGGPGDLPAACKPLLNKFAPFFLGRPHLADPDHGINPLDGVLKTTPAGDSGTSGIEYNGMTWVGVQYELEIQALVAYEFVAGE